MASGKRYAEIVISGDSSKAQNAIEAVGRAGGRMGTAVKAAGIAATAGVGAVAAGAGFAIKAASDFQDQMREVFTLLPGMSEEAMSAMSEQVKGFSNEFGVLPNEVVPALYQSISAGVPADNVFDFLETAQKAAKGGVTDLTTAVDGISSVVNAYGSDVLNAADASDLMFTAVRLGKTNFEELSASLFNVTPAAAALGVGFDQVTGALASLTAQGVPTSVATTSLRAALVELGKEGSVAFDAFKDITGGTFEDFIAQGNDLGDVVEMMAEHADASGTSIMNLFGSVEAGGAFTALAADIDGFNSNLDEMADASGATDAAFETMNQGLSASMERLQAKFMTTAITVGEWLLPKVEQLVAFFETRIIPAVQQVMTVFSEGGLSGVLALLGDKFREAWPSIKAALGEIAQGVLDWVAETAPKVLEQLGEWGQAFIDWIGPRIVPAIEELGKMIGALLDWLLNTGLPLAVEKLIEFGKAFIAWVAPLIPPLLLELAKLLGRLLDWIVTDAAPALIGALVSWTAQFIGWVVTDLTPTLLVELAKFLTKIALWLRDDAPTVIVTQLARWTYAFVDWAGDIPGKIFDALSSLGQRIWDAIKAAWDWVKGKAGELGSITLGSVSVPGLGGFNLGQVWPFHSGGTYIAPNGAREGLAWLRSGEFVSTPGNAAAPAASFAGGGDIVLMVDSVELGRVNRQTIEAEGRRGGPYRIRVEAV